MKVAIMQPYLFPYIGYFQLIHSVEKFVVYDNIEYTKKGWINRNRILLNGTDFLFSIPLKKDSDYLDINKRVLAENYEEHKKKFKGQLVSAYSKSPEFKKAYPVIEQCLDFTDMNLFGFIFNSIQQICSYLDIKTELIISSSLNTDFTLKGEQKVIAINKCLQSTVYVNAIGGQELYSRENFAADNIDLKFIKSDAIVYPQFNNEFTPHLSIIDVMMFNSREMIGRFLNSYTLI